MHIEAMVVLLQLPGIGSLKEKRARTRGIRDKWGKQAHLAVVESGFHDQWGQAEWMFVCLSSDRKLIDRTFSNIESNLQTGWDFVVTQIERARL